jgi:oligopeptide transport system substrate-binding protein
MKDPVIGGYTPEKIALRRAIIMGFDVDEEIRVIRKRSSSKGPANGVAGHCRA